MALIEIKKVLRIVTSHGLGTLEDPCRHVIVYVDADTLAILNSYDEFQDFIKQDK